ncbi:unnamed protein product [Brassica oleracea var. botrytis]|uniref:Uncharacterized protein n=1 Tax=Brassica oleracea TaxID=3712 RepID=A0A3P6CVL1_BRAOL|nr:unnamed protein product [Brassica oleracea]
MPLDGRRLIVNIHVRNYVSLQLYRGFYHNRYSDIAKVRLTTISINRIDIELLQTSAYPSWLPTIMRFLQ